MAEGGYDRIVTEVESIIRKHRAKLLEQLNVKQLVDYLYEKKMVNGPLMEKIEKADVRRESNTVYIDHLRSSGTVSTLQRFAQLLVDTSEILCNEVHREWGTILLKEIKKKNGGGAERQEQLPPTPLKNLDIMLNNEYMRIKDKFRDAYKVGPPSLEDLKTYCCDQIESLCESKILPKRTKAKYIKAAKDIEQCNDLKKLLRILFFRLNKWISFEFLERVVDYFKLALESVAKEIEDYKIKLKPFMEKRLTKIHELQQIHKEECENEEGFLKLAVHYGLDAGDLRVKDLLKERDFLADRLEIPRYLLIPQTWMRGNSITIVYWTLEELKESVTKQIRVKKSELIAHKIEWIQLGSLDRIVIDHHTMFENMIHATVGDIMISPEDSSILTIGPVGHGKATFLRFFCQNEDGFKAPHQIRGVKRFKEKVYHVFKTPGFEALAELDEAKIAKLGLKFLEEVKNVFVQAGEAITALFLVYNPHAGEVSHSMDQLLQAVKISWNHTILVVTHASTFLPVKSDSKQDQYQRWNAYLKSSDCPKSLKEMVKRVNNRCLLVESVPTKNEKYCITIAERCVEMLDRIQKDHGVYRNSLFLSAREEASKRLLKSYKSFGNNVQFRKVIDEQKEGFKDLKMQVMQFQKKNRALIPLIKEIAKKFQEFLKTLESAKKGGKIAAVTGVAGGIGLGVLGGILAPFTAGASLGLLIAGGVAAGTGIGTGAVVWGISKLIEKFEEEDVIRKAEGPLREYRKDLIAFYETYDVVTAKLKESIISLLDGSLIDEDAFVAAICLALGVEENDVTTASEVIQKIIFFHVFRGNNEELKQSLGKIAAGFGEFNQSTSAAEVAARTFLLAHDEGMPIDHYLLEAIKLMEIELEALENLSNLSNLN